MNTRTPTNVPATRIVYYPDPTLTDPHSELIRYTAREMAARRRTDQVLYTRWLARQAQIAERDRRTRRVFVIVGLTSLTLTLGFLGVAIWQICRAISSAATFDGSWLLGLALATVVLTGAFVGGHRCITLIEHRH